MCVRFFPVERVPVVGRPNCRRSVESYQYVGGCNWTRNCNCAVGSPGGVSPPSSTPTSPWVGLPTCATWRNYCSGGVAIGAGVVGAGWPHLVYFFEFNQAYVGSRM